MLRRRPAQIARHTILAALVALGTGSFVDQAGARHYRDRDRDRNGDEIAQSTLSGSPVMAIVSIKAQRVSFYDAKGGSMRARVSTGRTDYETPSGTFSVLRKEEEHYSNLYDDASMPFMQRLTWSGLSLHAGVLPGYPASHGCVRMPEDFAEQIYPLTRVGMRVIVAHDDVAPVEISHPFLLKAAPMPSIARPVTIPMAYESEDSNSGDESPFLPDLHNWPPRQAELDALKAEAADKTAAAERVSAEADALQRAAAGSFSKSGKTAKALRIAEAAKRDADERAAQVERGLADAKSPAEVKRWETAKVRAAATSQDASASLAAANANAQAAQDELARAKEAAAPAAAKKAAAVDAAKAARRNMLPISMFISLKTQRLYVRQGYEPVFDAPVTISDPGKPIGTHVYTAVDFMNGGKDLKWTVVSLDRRTSDDDYDAPPRKQRRFEVADAGPLVSDKGAAAAALDRITIAPDVLARLSGTVWPGSSLIVSDEEMSKETGKATDFIVVMSGEPQGGLKKRPHRSSDDFFRYSDRDYYYDNGYRTRSYRGGNSFFFWW